MRWCLAVVAAWSAAVAFAGPQHWGFGFGYLVTLETNQAGARAVSVYEPPLFVRDDTWLLRWRDASDQYADVFENGLAVGDFWPARMGAQDYVALVVRTPDGQPAVRIVTPPQRFGTEPWTVVGATLPLAKTPAVAGKPVYVTAGDVLGRGHAQLIVWLQAARAATTPAWVVVYDPPSDPAQGEWQAVAILAADALGGPTAGLLASDFWGDGHVCLATLPSTDGLHLNVYQLAAGATPQEARATLVTSAPWTPNDPAQKFVAADFLKDGFAYVASAAPQSATWSFATGPKRADRPYKTSWVRQNETFAGAQLAGQAAGTCQHIMNGTDEAPFGEVLAAGAGRVFGYILAPDGERKEQLFKPWHYVGHDDVEIAFVHRTPVYRLGVPKRWQDGNWPWEPDDHYGWPHAGDEVVYEVNLKNNGSQPIPAGQVTLRAWIDSPHRNADIVPAAGAAPTVPAAADLTITIDQPIPPFDPAKPEYTVVPVPVQWPFKLVQPAGWTWKKINVREIGERWMVLRLDYAQDENLRNNRYEWALNALLLRPVFRFDVDAPDHPTEDGLEGRPERKINTLAYRAPVVLGDPESKEYYARKLADAVQCMWERSRTSTRDQVWQRMVFDSYRLYDSQGRDGLRPLNRDDDWSHYEAPRENEHWLGLWGSYERFLPTDGGAELHETGHLFHRIGDLYHYFINPINLRSIHMADGEPVQEYTYCWGLDSYCSGHAIIGEATCDLHRYLEGVRYGLGFGWHLLLPDKLAVRVLDRDGDPVPNAQVQLWLHPQNKLHEQGVTGPDGTLPLSFPAQPGEERTFTVFEPFNLKLWNGDALNSLAEVFTVALPGYTDFAILGTEDTDAHSRYTLMHRSLTDGAGWTWDLHTLYKAGAPEPDFELTAAVQGRGIAFSMTGGKAGEYRIYRRWEPTYTFEQIGTVTAANGAAQFTADMGAADWFMHDRYRAAYYVTGVTADGAESLPRRVYGIALDKVTGCTDIGAGRLMVALNCGRAEPFGVICHGTTPEEEAIKHFRFGHTAAKIAGSHVNAQRYFATLLSADMGWGDDRFFDLIQFDKPDRHQSQYPVLQNTAECDVTDFTDATPQIITITPDRDARAAICPGDWAHNGDDRARILAVEDASANAARASLRLTLDKPLYTGDSRRAHVRIEFGGGTPGDNAELRELQHPLGLTVLPPGDDGLEYIAIADTGNHRVVLWDGATHYVTQWQPADADAAAFNPVAAAPDNPHAFYVLDRRTAADSQLYRLEFDGGQTLTVAHGYPLAVPAAARAGDTEMGLAVVEQGGKCFVAVTDASQQRVLELTLPPGGAPLRQTPRVYTQPDGIYVGDAALTNPTDVAYTLEDGVLHLYCVDGHNRVVRLR